MDKLVLAIVKEDGERYVFVYEDADHDQLMHILDKFAADPELSFSEKDAQAVGSKAELLKTALTNKLKRF
jgi:hypothetical protein